MAFAHMGTVNMGADYNAEQEFFLLAVERFRRVYQRNFPTCTELLALLHGLGYRRVLAADVELIQKLGMENLLGRGDCARDVAERPLAPLRERLAVGKRGRPRKYPKK